MTLSHTCNVDSVWQKPRARLRGGGSVCEQEPQHTLSRGLPGKECWACEKRRGGEDHQPPEVNYLPGLGSC